MMIPIAMFARAEDVCDGKANRDFSMVAVMFLCEPEYQSDAVDLLNVITRHKLPFDVFSRLLEAIPGLSSPLLQPIPPSSTGGMSLPEDTAECMIFQRSYATMVFSIMSENISQATDKYYLQSTPRAQEILGNYVMLMAKLIGQPSRRLAGDVAKEWTKIFREDSIANIPWMSDVCAVLLQVYTSKLERILWIKEHVSSIDGDTLTMYPADEISAAEFDDYDEWMDYMGALKAQVKSLCAVLAVKFPIVCLSFLQQKVTSLLSLPISVAKGDSNDAEDVIQWQAFATVLEFLCSNLMPAELTAGDEVSKQVLGQLHMMIELLLSWKPPAHSALLLQRLQCLNNCSAVLRSAPVDLLQRVFADLFRHDSVTLTAASSSAVSPTQLSEKAATIIAHLCQVCGEAVVGDVSLLNAIVAQVMRLT